MGARQGDAAAALTFGGRGILSAAELDVRFGYAGYRWDGAIGKYHVRNRVYDPYAGRWLTRDPAGYDGGINFYEYVSSDPLVFVDPWGLCATCPMAMLQPEQPEKKKKDVRKKTDPPERPAGEKPLPGEERDPDSKDTPRDFHRDHDRDNWDDSIKDIEDLAKGVNKRTPMGQAVGTGWALCKITWRRFWDDD
jgi:RHS repeat-associated protein